MSSLHGLHTPCSLQKGKVITSRFDYLGLKDFVVWMSVKWPKIAFLVWCSFKTIPQMFMGLQQNVLYTTYPRKRLIATPKHSCSPYFIPGHGLPSFFKRKLCWLVVRDLSCYFVLNVVRNSLKHPHLYSLPKTRSIAKDIYWTFKSCSAKVIRLRNDYVAARHSLF